MPENINAEASTTPSADVPTGSAVSRCICFGVEFTEVAEITRGCTDEYTALAEAHRRTRCGARCGLCLPYVQLTIKTGQTAFPILWAEDFRRHGINPGKVSQIQKALYDGTYGTAG